MEDIKTINRPCHICMNIKNGNKFKVRDDNGAIQTITFIAYCPYCGRFLKEQYKGNNDHCDDGCCDEMNNSQYKD